MELSGESQICLGCVGGDEFLWRRLDEAGEGQDDAACAICGVVGQTQSLEMIADVFDPIYRRSVRYEGDYRPWKGERETPDAVIREMLSDPNDDLVTALVDFLSENEAYSVHHDGNAPMYDAMSESYVLDVPPSGAYEEQWAGFVAGVKHHGRFFLDHEREYLKKIFEPVLRGDLHRGTPPIVTLGAPDSEISVIYRGRPANSQSEQRTIFANPTRELAPPPPSLRTGNRMNAAGTAAFYGATDVTTCVAELAVPFGGAAIVGKFEFISSVRVLDLRLLSRANRFTSYFDPQVEDNAGYLRFMRGLRNRLRLPVLKGNETLDYLPTQMIAEYLAHDAGLDGIMFVSSVVGEAAAEYLYEDEDEDAAGEADIARKTGVNVVLFPHAAIVEGDLASPKRRILKVEEPVLLSGGTGWLFVKVAKEAQPPVDSPEINDPLFNDALEPTLKLVEDKVVLARPRAIEYDVMEFKPTFSDDPPPETDF
jgi:hypothetical protein